jgi:hypothetical protein
LSDSSIDPDVGDNYPVVTYAHDDRSSGAFNSSSVLSSIGWRGRTAGGHLVSLTLTISGFVRGDATYGGGIYEISALKYWPGIAGTHRSRIIMIPIDLYVVDTAYVYTDYKGRLPDVTATSSNLQIGYPLEIDGSPVTRRAVGGLWMPGMPTSGPVKI